MERTEASTDRNVGRVIAGKFQIESVLGLGNGGMVYGATHLQLRREVAIKTLRASIAADPTAVARFAREAQLASQLDHPNVVQVFDHGTEPDGLTYIAMEKLEGGTLTRLIRDESPLSRARIVAVLSQVLAAAAAAHRLGIVHRDLKPDNIMLVTRTDDDGREVETVKVADFGMAKAFAGPAQGGEQITTFGTVGGTPEYMSPEQAQGLELDGRSDVYAIGVVLYEMITGVVPFAGDSPLAVLNKHVNNEVPPPATRRADVDPALAAIAMRALHKDPGARFADASEMRNALAKAGEGDAPTASARPVAEPSVLLEFGTPRTATVAPKGRRIAALPIAAGVALALASAGVIALIVHHRSTPSTAPAEPAQTVGAGSPGASSDDASEPHPSHRIQLRPGMRRMPGLGARRVPPRVH